MASLLAVLVGGALGTGLRLGLDLLFAPISTLLINIVGAFALGLLTARVWPTARPWVRAGLGPGLLGSFTTFSAFAVALVSLGSAGDWALGVLYLVATIVLGFGAALGGLRLGRDRNGSARSGVSPGAPGAPGAPGSSGAPGSPGSSGVDS